MKQSIKSEYMRPTILDVQMKFEASAICASLDNLSEEQFDFDWDNNN